MSGIVYLGVTIYQCLSPPPLQDLHIILGKTSLWDAVAMVMGHHHLHVPAMEAVSWNRMLCFVASQTMPWILKHRIQHLT